MSRVGLRGTSVPLGRHCRNHTAGGLKTRRRLKPGFSLPHTAQPNSLTSGVQRLDNGMTIMFKDGGAIRIHTESTFANSPVSARGVAAIDEGDVLIA